MDKCDWLLELVTVEKVKLRKQKRKIYRLEHQQEIQERNRKYSYSKEKVCPDCGKPITNVSTRCASCVQRGERNSNWTGGNSFDYVLAPGHILEHRLVIAQAIGRPLKPEEVVHHIDGDPSNNVRENLELFENQSKHMKYHYRLRKMGKTPSVIKGG